MRTMNSVVVVAMVWLVMATATPVRRSADLEARRRSAIDRSMIRFGRSPPEASAADIREAFQRQARRGTSFVRFGRNQPSILSTDDLISLLRTYEDYDSQFSKRAPTNFIRLGRDPKFIRFGRSPDEEKDLGLEQGANLVVSGYPERKHRARDNFIRLGRDSEELGHEGDEVEERRKRGTEPECLDCQV